MRLQIKSQAYFLKASAMPRLPKKLTINIIKASLIQPEKAKCEWPCNKCFWSIKGKENAILYLKITPSNATIDKLTRAILNHFKDTGVIKNKVQIYNKLNMEFIIAIIKFRIFVICNF